MNANLLQPVSQGSRIYSTAHMLVITEAQVLILAQFIIQRVHLTHKVLTYVEYRAVSSVFQNIDPPPHAPPSPPSECVLPPHQRRGVPGGYTLAMRWGGVGGSIFWNMSDKGLASYSTISLRPNPSGITSLGPNNCHPFHTKLLDIIITSNISYNTNLY